METSFKTSDIDKIMEDLRDIKAAFASYDVELILGHGALLGPYRDGDFISWDDDVDFTVVQPVSFKTKKAIGWTLFDLGFEPQDMKFNVFGRWEPNDPGYNGSRKTGVIICERNFHYTIFFFYKEDDEYICIPRLGARPLIMTPTKFYRKRDKITVHGEEFVTPYPIEDYLRWTYGEDWRTPREGVHAKQYIELHE